MDCLYGLPKRSRISTNLGAISADTVNIAVHGHSPVLVAATFPVVLPFVMFADVGVAKNVSRAVALALLFGGGLALGRYAGFGSWKVGLIMVGLGSGLVVAITALGG